MSAQRDPVLILEYENESILVPRPDSTCSYDELREIVSSTFPTLEGREADIIIATNEFDSCRGVWTKVSGPALPIVLPLVTTLKISLVNRNAQGGFAQKIASILFQPRLQPVDPPTSPVVSRFPSSSAQTGTQEAPFFVYVRNGGHWVTSICIDSNATVGKLKEQIQQVAGIPVSDQLLITRHLGPEFPGRVLDHGLTLDAYGIQSGQTIDMVDGSMKVGKPVIYLFSPVEREASVKLSLVPQWQISVLYPVVPVKQKVPSGQEMEWAVRTSPDGTLHELSTGLNVSYLFWEGETTAEIPLSPPPSPILSSEDGETQNTEIFIPNQPHLGDHNSVLVATNEVTPYLDATLKALGLHTEARTSFITSVDSNMLLTTAFI
ncbi:ubiquitin family protein [Coprinopsis cinerea AmutBmut pab1-1]|nr:ubiquitin family protein [Coprinopsis cinerea AmutBmut pab1-1]